MSELREVLSRMEEHFRGYEDTDGYTKELFKKARAALAAKVPAGPRGLIEQCRDALAEELGAWDIDPPLFHVKEAHDACVAWLAPAPAQEAEEAVWRCAPDARYCASCEVCKAPPAQAQQAEVVAVATLIGMAECWDENAKEAEAEGWHTQASAFHICAADARRAVKMTAGKVRAKPEAQQAKGDPKLLAILNAPMTLQEAYGEGWCDRKQFKNFDEAWQQSTTRFKAEAKPEAQQPLTGHALLRAWGESDGLRHGYGNFARAVEKACAEAWGVKLAGIGTSGEAS